MRIQKLSACMMVLALAATSLGFAAVGEADRHLHGQGESLLQYMASDPIRINSDADFEGQEWPGDGSQANPYIIEGWQINGTGQGYCIYIGNTTAHFVVRGNYVQNATGSDYWTQFYRNSGIYLHNVSAGTLEDNIVTDTPEGYGMVVEHSENVLLTGGTVYETEGNSGLTLMHSRNITVQGMYLNDNKFAAISISNSDNVRILHNEIHENCGDETGIDIHTSRGFLIHGNNITDGTGHGVHLWNSSGTISDNIITGNTFHGIFARMSGGITVSGNQVSGNQLSGIFLDWSEHSIISGNTIFHNIEYGIQLQNSHGNRFRGNTVYDNGWDGAYLDQSHGNTFSGNSFTGHSAGIGIHLFRSENNTFEDSDALDSHIGIWLRESHGNIFLGGEVADSTGQGISLSQSNRNRVEGFTVTRAVRAQRGIHLEQSSNNTLAHNNVTNHNDGVFITLASRHNYIQGNVLHGNDYGIRVGGMSDTSHHNRIIGNVIRDNANDGIYLIDSRECRIIENEIENNNAGVRFVGSYLNTIARNTLTGNAVGVSILMSGNNLVLHNNFLGNTDQAADTTGGNMWHGGYPAGGNHWDDHPIHDAYSGAAQDVDGADGIADIDVGGLSPYIVDAGVQDDYPWVQQDGWTIHHGPVCNLDTMEYFPGIQAAVTDPGTLDGHTVKVAPGTYNGAITLHKALHLLGSGPDHTTINGTGAASAVTISDRLRLQVNDPPAIEGLYSAGGADFGPQPGEPGWAVTGDVVYADPPMAENPITNDVNGKIALIDRGATTFVTKVKNAQDAGAIGVIVVNNAEGTMNMGGTDESITIPSLFITQSHGDLIKSETGVHVSFTVSERAGTLEGFTVANTGAADTASAVRLAYAHGNAIRDNRIQGTGRGIYLDYSEEITLAGNEMLNTGLSFLGNLENYGTHRIDGSNTVNGKPVAYISGSVGGMVQGAGQVILVNSTGVTVEDCDTSNTNIGIILYQSEGCTVSGNTVGNNSLHGMQVMYGANNTLEGNTLHDNADYGFYVLLSQGNNVTGNNVSGGTRGIFLEQSEGNMVSANTVRDASVVGILLLSGQGFAVEDNELSGNQWGIYLVDVDYSLVTGNTILGSSYSAMHIQNSNHNHVAGNTFRWSERDGVYLTAGSHHNTIAFNQITDNDIDGIYALDAHNNTFQGNNISGNAGYGASFGAATADNLLYLNRFQGNGNNSRDNGANTWDAGDPALGGKGGNRWDDYDGPDRGDGVGAWPYNITGDNRDNYPLVTDRMAAGFSVSLADIQAGNAPAIQISNARDDYANPLEGEHPVSITIDGTTADETLIFTEGTANHAWSVMTVAGDYTAQATLIGLTRSDAFSVLLATIHSVTITPALEQAVQAGQALHFTAEARDEHGNLITDDAADFTWQNAPGGVFNSTATGRFPVTATRGGVTSPATNVTVIPAAVHTVTVSPSGPVTVAPGVPVHFAPEARDIYGNLITDDAADFTWQNAVNGVFSEMVEGEYQVTAAYGGMTSDPANVTVDAGEDDTVPVTVGPVLDNEGNPVEGAGVTVEFDGTNYSGTTNATGYAVIHLPETAPGEQVGITITKDGYETVSYQATLGTDGEPDTAPPAMVATPPADDDEPPAEDAGAGFPVWLLLVAAVCIIVALAIFMLSGRKGKDPEPMQPEDFPEMQQAPEQAPETQTWEQPPAD